MAFRRSRVRSASAPPTKLRSFRFSDIGERPDRQHSVRFCEAMIPKASSIYRGSAFADYAEGCSSEGMREVYVRRVDDPKSEKYASGKLRGRQNESIPSYSGSPVPAVTISPTQVAGFSSL